MAGLKSKLAKNIAMTLGTSVVALVAYFGGLKVGQNKQGSLDKDLDVIRQKVGGDFSNVSLSFNGPKGSVEMKTNYNSNQGAVKYVEGDTTTYGFYDDGASNTFSFDKNGKLIAKTATTAEGISAMVGVDKGKDYARKMVNGEWVDTNDVESLFFVHSTGQKSVESQYNAYNEKGTASWAQKDVHVNAGDIGPAVGAVEMTTVREK